MKDNQFKNFNVFKVGLRDKANLYDVIGEHFAGEDFRVHDTLDALVARDPGNTEWSNIGFIEPRAGETDFFHDLDGAGWLCCMEVSERVLPAAVRDEKVRKKVAELEDAEGRKVGKKEFRIIRDDVELELLPQAFIRRKRVMVAFTPDNKLIVFTGSKGACEPVVAKLLAAFSLIDQDLTVAPLDTPVAPVTFMTDLILSPGDTASNGFSYVSPMLLKGDEGNAVRVKDLQVDRTAYIDLIKQGYRVNELGLTYTMDQDDEPSVAFRLSHSLAFKSFAMSDVLMTQDLADGGFHAVAWLAVKTARMVIDDLIDVLSHDNEDDEL